MLDGEFACQLSKMSLICSTVASCNNNRLLLIQDEFRLPLCAVLSEYQSWFAKKTPFDPVIYGFTSVVSLLEALPSVVEVCTSRNEHLLSRNMLIPSYTVQASVLALRFPPELS